MFPSNGKEKVLQKWSDDGFDPGSGRLDLRKQFLMRVPGREPQNIAGSSLDPFCGQPPKLSAQSGDVPMLNFLGPAEELESQYQVVGPENGFHVGGIGPEAASGDLGHRIGSLELPQQKLLETPVAVESPDRRRAEIQVGH